MIAFSGAEKSTFLDKTVSTRSRAGWSLFRVQKSTSFAKLCVHGHANAYLSFDMHSPCAFIAELESFLTMLMTSLSQLIKNKSFFHLKSRLRARSARWFFKRCYFFLGSVFLRLFTRPKQKCVPSDDLQVTPI